MADKNKMLLENWQIKAFAVENVKYYQKKWNEHQDSKYYAGWNWVAFFFGFEWAFYRKMYKEVAIVYLLMFLGNFIFPVLDMNGNTFNLLFAIWGNALYRLKLLNTLKKANGKNRNELEKTLSSKGGTSYIALGVCILLQIVQLVFLGPYKWR